MANTIDIRELERRSQDRLKVINPTDSEASVMWDRYTHRIPAHGEAVFPRYLAEKYIAEMTDKILTERQDTAVKTENEKRKAQGKDEMEKYGEQEVFEGKVKFAQGVANPEARKSVMKTLYGGVVEEYGLDVSQEERQSIDTRPLDMQLLEEIQSEVDGNLSPIEQLPGKDDLEEKNVFQLQKMARDKGVDFDKADKKNDLIAKISQQ